MLENDRALRDLDTFQYVMTLLLHGRIRYAHHQADRQWVGVRRRGKIEHHLLHSMFNTGLNNAIYAARSALVDGTHAHSADEGFFSPSKRSGFDLLVEIVAQRSLIGWLRDPHRRN
jgi:hypothetical protein